MAESGISNWQRRRLLYLRVPIADDVRSQVYVMAHIDVFLVIGWFIIGGLVLIVLLRPAPEL
jgi:hypothetical protein